MRRPLIFDEGIKLLNGHAPAPVWVAVADERGKIKIMHINPLKVIFMFHISPLESSIYRRTIAGQAEVIRLSFASKACQNRALSSRFPDPNDRHRRHPSPRHSPAALPPASQVSETWPEVTRHTPRNLPVSISAAQPPP
jgi:hypothetical protein